MCNIDIRFCGGRDRVNKMGLEREWLELGMFRMRMVMGYICRDVEFNAFGALISTNLGSGLG